jgi:single-strand DNA-binding protein
MPSFNKVILAGNLTRDPELRYTPKGTAVGRIGLAINRTWRDEAGQQKEEVTFVDVDAWGKQAETINQYLKKGRPILVEGRLKLDSWDDKQTGQKRHQLRVVMETFQFLDSSPEGARGKGGGGSGGSVERGSGEPKGGAIPADAHVGAPGSGPEDDVPF